MARLTVNGLKAKKQPGRYGDGDGLYLIVKPSGARSWVLRIQQDGRRRDVGLGSVAFDIGGASGLPDVPILHRRVLSLAEAREKANLLRQYAKAGRDVIAERDRDRRQVPIFKQVVIDCHAEMSKGWTDRHAASFLSSLEEHAYPVLQRLPVDEIDAGKLIEALSPIWTTKPVMARKVRQRICTALSFAKAKGWRKEGPPQAPDVTRGLAKQPKRGNFAAMPYAALPAFVASIEEGTATTGRNALLFAILTAARSGEVRAAKWSQIDIDKALWRRPAEMMKASEAHDVTLCPQALDLLRRLDGERLLKVDGLIFPGMSGKMMSDMTLTKVLRDAKQPFTVHGFRSTFRDWAAEKMHRIPDPVAEAALAHKVPDEVVAAYKRTKFLDLRRELLDAWGRYAAGGGEVVALRVAS